MKDKEFILLEQFFTLRKLNMLSRQQEFYAEIKYQGSALQKAIFEQN
jgi:hypothetical protein